MQTRYPLTAITGLALMAAWMAAAAEETFVCADGSTLGVDDDSRTALRQHPCVEAWFAGGNPQPTRRTRSTSAWPPIVYRHTLRHAATPRDLRRRPAFVTRSRGRASRVSSGKVADARTAPRHPTPLPTAKLGVIVKLPRSPGR